MERHLCQAAGNGRCSGGCPNHRIYNRTFDTNASSTDG